MTKKQTEPEGIYETVGKYNENTYEAVSPFASENLYEVVDTNIDPNKPYVNTVTVTMGIAFRFLLVILEILILIAN